MLAVYDTLRAGAPTTFEWLLHALHRMKVGPGEGAITLEDGDAREALSRALRGLSFSPHHPGLYFAAATACS